MSNRFQIQTAARILRDSGIVAYPTEGVYGLGCLPEDRASVQRILSIKGRSASAGLILIAPEYELLEEWINPTQAERISLDTTFLHPVTWIVTAAPHTPTWLTGGRHTLAVRLSSHPIVQSLCNSVHSALISTSANRSGHRAAKSALEVRYWLGNSLDYVVSGQLGGYPGPSEIRSASSNHVIRPLLTNKSV